MYDYFSFDELILIERMLRRLNSLNGIETEEERETHSELLTLVHTTMQEQMQHNEPAFSLETFEDEEIPFL